MCPFFISSSPCLFLSLTFLHLHYLDLLTLGVVPSVKLKELSRIVREGVHIDAVPQHNHYPVDITQNTGP